MSVSEVWRCQECGACTLHRGSSEWPATWPVTLWCPQQQGETLHDRA